MDVNYTILFFAINGSGMGHLSRCLSYARSLKQHVHCSFFSLASALEFINELGFPSEYYISPFWSCNNNFQWNNELAIRLGMTLKHIQPDVIVFDGTWPFQGFLSTCKAYRKQGHPLKMVWSRRGFLKKSARTCPVDEQLFDMILEPGEFGCEYSVRRLPSGTQKVTVPPVTLLQNEEFLSREQACSALNLDPDKHYVLFSLGSGNLKDVNSLGCQLLQAFQQHGYTPVWACPPISVHDIELPPDIKALSVYPLAQYLKAFDILVGAAGYNTCYEIMQTGIPSLLIPNTLLADDQARRAQLVAEHAPAVVSACDTPEELNAAVMKVIHRAQQDRVYTRPLLNGAKLAARALLSLAERP